MKPVFFVCGLAILVISLSASSCDHHETVPLVNQKYEGSWQYVGYSGGFAGFPFKKDSTHQQILQLKDTTYVRMTEGKKQCGSYRIISKIKNGYIPGPYIAFDHENKGPAIRLKKDTLILTQPVADGMSSWYVKSDTALLSPCMKMHPMK